MKIGRSNKDKSGRKASSNSKSYDEAISETVIGRETKFQNFKISRLERDRERDRWQRRQGIWRDSTGRRRTAASRSPLPTPRRPQSLLLLSRNRPNTPPLAAPMSPNPLPSSPTAPLTSKVSLSLSLSFSLSIYYYTVRVLFG
jgi:hypothetical protein